MAIPKVGFSLFTQRGEACQLARSEAPHIVQEIDKEIANLTQARNVLAGLNGSSSNGTTVRPDAAWPV